MAAATWSQPTTVAPAGHVIERLGSCEVFRAQRNPSRCPSLESDEEIEVGAACILKSVIDEVAQSISTRGMRAQRLVAETQLDVVANKTHFA